MSLLTCEQCRVGRYRPTKAPYLEPINGRIMVVPHVPAQVCDVCGQLVYDIEFMHQLEHLLDEFAKSTPPVGKGKRFNLSKTSPDWRPTERSI